MQVSVEKVSKIECRLTIAVPAETVDKAYSKQLDILAKKAKIKGFRPGKAPMSVIKGQFGPDAQREAVNETIQHAIHDAMVKNNLNPVSTPQVDLKVMTPGQPLEFVVTFETLPEVESVAFSIPNVEKPIVTIDETDVNLVLEQLQKQFTKWTLVDRAAKNKDRVVIDYYAIFEGKSDIENKVQNFPIELGANIMIPGFEEGLIGKKTGDDVSLQLKFPSDFQIAEKAGKAIEFSIQVKQVFEAEKPYVEEQFVKQLGVKSGKLEDLMAQVKQSLEQERDRLINEKMKEQIFRQLLEQNPIDVPKSLIAREAKVIHDEVYAQHQHHDHDHHSEDEMTKFNEVAKKRVMLGLLIGEYAKKNQLKADAARVNKRIIEIASVYENPREVIEWLSTNSERRQGIEAQVMEDQVMDKLLEGVQVIEKPMTYAELKGIRI